MLRVDCHCPRYGAAHAYRKLAVAELAVLIDADGGAVLYFADTAKLARSISPLTTPSHISRGIFQTLLNQALALRVQFNAWYDALLLWLGQLLIGASLWLEVSL